MRILEDFKTHLTDVEIEKRLEKLTFIIALDTLHFHAFNTRARICIYGLEGKHLLILYTILIGDTHTNTLPPLKPGDSMTATVGTMSLDTLLEDGFSVQPSSLIPLWRSPILPLTP